MAKQIRDTWTRRCVALTKLVSAISIFVISIGQAVCK